MKKFAFSFVFCLLLVTSSAWASTDSVDWAQLGPPFTVLSTPQNWTSAGGLTGQVGVFGPFNFERRDQGNGCGEREGFQALRITAEKGILQHRKRAEAPGTARDAESGAGAQSADKSNA